MAPRYGKQKDDSSNYHDFERDAEWQSHEDEANNGSKFFEDEQDLSEQRSQLLTVSRLAGNGGREK